MVIDNTIYGGTSLSYSGVTFNTSTSPGFAQQFNLFNNESGNQDDYTLYNATETVDVSGPLTLTSDFSTPAPVPGAGWLSYITLFLAAIWFRGRRIFALVRTFVGGFA